MSTTPYSPADAVVAHGPEAGVAVRHLQLRPEDTEGPARARRLKELGIGDRRPIPEFDAFSRDLATRLAGLMGGVNLIDDTGQYFAGLYVSPAAAATDPGQDEAEEGDGRALPPEVAFCPHVVARRRALVLEDLHDFARYSVDPVVDLLGVRAYLGVPLMDPSGIALGTAWVVDRQPARWGREGLAVAKDMTAALMERIVRGDFRDAGA